MSFHRAARFLFFDSGELAFFWCKRLCFLLLAFFLMCYSNHLLTLYFGGNSVYCSGILSGLVVWGGDFLLWFLFTLSSWFQGGGGGCSGVAGVIVRGYRVWVGELVG